MFRDIFLTRNGDFAFSTVDTLNKNETFEFTFHIATSESLMFNFNILNKVPEEIHPNRLVFDFYVYEPKYDKSAKVVQDSDFINQAIKLRLDTELGTVRGNENLGCELHTLMHSNIPNNKLKSKIEAMVRNALMDVLPNATIEIQFLNTDYLNYHDSIRIVIVNNEELYYYTI